MLSAFGHRLTAIAKRAGMSRYALAKACGMSYSALIESMRDRAWAKEHAKRWFAPNVEKVAAMADALALTGQERDDLLALARAEHSDEHLVKDWQRRSRDLETALERLAELEALVMADADATDAAERAKLAALPRDELLNRLVLARRVNRRLAQRASRPARRRRA